jgi:hypothetical protein
MQASIFSRPEWLRLNLQLLPALSVALLPKCPLCLLSIMSVVGLGSVVTVAWLLPLMLVFLGATLLSLGLSARRRHRYGPLALGLLAACSIALGKFYFNSNFAAGAGIALLFASSLWNAPIKRNVNSRPDCNC